MTDEIKPLRDAFDEGRGAPPLDTKAVFNAAVTFLTGTPVGIDTSSNSVVVSFSTEQFQQIADVLMLVATQESSVGLVNAERTGGRITMRELEPGVYEIGPAT